MHGLENVCRLEPLDLAPAEFVRKHIQQDLRIGVRVQVPTIVIDDEVFQLLGVDEITVVTEADAKRRIDVERLCLVKARAARCRVANMAKPDVTTPPGELM